MLFEPGNVKDILDGLLLCAFDERAGVDDDNVRLDILGRDLISRGINFVQHNLGVQLILGTTERNKSDFHVYSAFLLYLFDPKDLRPRALAVFVGDLRAHEAFALVEGIARLGEFLADSRALLPDHIGEEDDLAAG